MAAVLITTTRAQDVQALGKGGQRATESWSALHRLLEQRLGREHVALLAEPVTNAAQGETDWYAETEQPVRLLSSIPPTEQAAVRQEFERLRGEISALAATMEAARSDADRFLGAMLRVATQVPDESYIYAAGKQPILVAWGHDKAGTAGASVVLSGDRVVDRGPTAVRPPPVAPQRPAASGFGLCRWRRTWRRQLGRKRNRRSYRWSLLLTTDAIVMRRCGSALAAALLVFLSSLYIVLRDPFRWYAVAEPACQLPRGEMALRADLQTAADKEADLRLQLAQLSTDAGSRRLMCPPVQPAAQPAPPARSADENRTQQPVPPPRSADENRAEQRGAQRGKLTITLAWDDRNDLDLRVKCPAGDTISFEQPNVCGGYLDVDSNNDHVTASAEPVENVFFSDPQPGAYRILVDPFAMRVARSTPFRLTVQQDGRPDRVITGTANNGARFQEVATVTVDARP